MAMTSIPIFFEKCRLCLKNPGIVNVKDLYEEISLFTGVKISVTDNLPQNICSKCSEILANVKELRETALRSDIYLHSLIDDVDSDAETLVIDEGEQCHTKEKEPVERNSTTSRTRTKGNEEVSSQITVRKDLFRVPSVVVSTSMRERDKTRSKYFKISKTLKFENDEEFDFECEVCKKTFETRKKLYLHERVHNKKISCAIPECKKLFTTKGDLTKHLRTHTGIKPYVCSICDRKFTQKVTLKLHKENVHYEFNV